MTMTIEIVLRRIITVRVRIYIVPLKKMKVTFKFAKFVHLIKSFDHYVMALLEIKQLLFQTFLLMFRIEKIIQVTWLK